MPGGGGNVKQPLYTIHGGEKVLRFSASLQSTASAIAILATSATERFNVLGITIGGYYNGAAALDANVAIELVEQSGARLAYLGSGTISGSGTRYTEAFPTRTLWFGSGVRLATGADLWVQFANGVTVTTGAVLVLGTVFGEYN